MQSGEAVIGTVVDGFRIERQLGAGGMGAVFIARHTRLTSLVKVVKFLLGEYKDHPEVRRRFEREAEAIASLQHEHIIKIDGFGALPDGQLYLIMPLLDGRSLDVHIHQNGKLTPHHVLHIVAQVASALEHAHARGIVHRDLKPANVFLSTTARNPYFATLIDFGIAHVKHATDPAAAPRTQAGMAIGTPGYMAPEQFLSAGSVGPTADVYSAAIMIWEMLCGPGQTPWGYHDPRVLLHLQMTERPVPPTDIPRDWQPILMAALSPNASDRPPSMRALVNALASALPGIPPHVPSGADVVGRVAPDLLIKATPDEATVRKASSNPPSTPLVWPQRATDVPSVVPAASDPAIAAPAQAAPSMPATVNARPAPAAPPPTTLSASSGVSVSVPAPTKPRSSMVIALGVGVAVLAAVLVFGVARLRGAGDRQMGAQPTTAAPADAAVATMPPDAELTTTPSLDAALPLDAAMTVEAPIDAGLDATTSKASKRRPRDTSSTKTSSTKAGSTKPSTDPRTQPSGSAAPSKFDPNAPLGED